MSSDNWDATRCLRLIRPLRAHLLAFEKHKERKQELRSRAASIKTTTARYQSKSANDDSPDWVARGARERKRRQITYKSRPRNADPLIPRPTFTIENDTPTLESFENMAELMFPGPIEEQPGAVDKTISRGAVRRKGRLDKFNIFTGDCPVTTLSSLRQSYLAVLRVTSPTEEHFVSISGHIGVGVAMTERKSNVPSLRSISLRQTTSLIEQEEIRQSSLDRHERTDTFEDVCLELDDVLSSKEHGLPMQAQLLRAYATKLLCRTVLTGRMPPQFVMNMVAEDALHPRESQQILVAFAQAMRPDSQRKNCPSNRMLPDLQKAIVAGAFLLSAPGEARESLAVPRACFSNPTIPVDWLALPQFMRIWSTTVRSISTVSPQSQEASSFISEIIQKGCGLVPTSPQVLYSLRHIPVIPQKPGFDAALSCQPCRHRAPPHQEKKLREAFTTSISSFFTILTAMAIARQDQSEIVAGQIHSVVYSAASQMIAKGVQSITDDPAHNYYYSNRCAVILFAGLVLFSSESHTVFATSTTPEVSTDFILALETEMADGEQPSGILDALPSFLVSVARACQRMGESPASVYLESILASLVAIDGISKRAKALILNICQAAATELDMDCPELMSYTTDWTELFFTSQAVEAESGSDEPPSEDEPMSGYRWEPMISEWIKQTPAKPRSDAAIIPGKPVVRVRAKPRRHALRRAMARLADTAHYLQDTEEFETDEECESESDQEMSENLPSEEQHAEIELAACSSLRPRRSARHPRDHRLSRCSNTVRVIVPVLAPHRRFSSLSQAMLSPSTRSSLSTASDSESLPSSSPTSRSTSFEPSHHTRSHLHKRSLQESEPQRRFSKRIRIHAVIPDSEEESFASADEASHDELEISPRITLRQRHRRIHDSPERRRSMRAKRPVRYSAADDEDELSLA